MLSTKNGMQEQCISPKDTLSLPASLRSAVLLPLFSLSENYWHELQIAKNLCTTHPHADQPGHSDYHILQFKPCNEKSSLCQNQRSRRNSHSCLAHSLLCAKCPLNCLRPQDLQRNQNFTSPQSPLCKLNLSSRKTLQKRKFWPERHLWIRPSFPRPQTKLQPRWECVCVSPSLSGLPSPDPLK